MFKYQVKTITGADLTIFSEAKLIIQEKEIECINIMIETQNKQIREELIKLGWTPPVENKNEEGH